MRATQLTRDASPGVDDRVTLELDPHHDHRSVSRFTVTARGTQSDAIAGGRAAVAAFKGRWTAAAQRTPTGWTAELAIPFALLDVDPKTDTIGVNFSRYQHRTRESSYWADVTPQRLADEAGHLTGLRVPTTTSPRSLATSQYLSSNPRRTPGATPGESATGADVRYQWGRGLTSMISARPDFSGVDGDVASAGFSYTEKFVADRRPFFQEGRTFFGDRELFYSGRIEDFDVGVKTFGRVDDYQVGVLATTDADQRARRLRRPGGARRGPGVQRERHRRRHQAEDAREHRRAGAGGGTGGIGIFRWTATSPAPPPPDHPATARASAPRLPIGARGGIPAAGPTTPTPASSPPTGSCPPISSARPAAAPTAATRVKPGQAWLRSTDASVSYQVRETETGRRQREATSVYFGADTAANIQLSAGVTTGIYRPRGAAPGAWTDALNDDRSYLASAAYQSPTGQFGYGALYSWGVAGPQTYDSLSPNLWLAPSPHVSFAYSFERATYDQVRRQHVVSGTWQINGSQAVAARWVEDGGGYYRLSYRRSAGAEHGRVRGLQFGPVRAAPLRREAGVDAVGAAAAVTRAFVDCA